MLPPLIVETALERGIRILGITDHNATGNIAAVMQAARGSDLHILPGMELQTREEVHSICLFDTLEQAAAFQRIVDDHLPAMENSPDYFGMQLIVDQEGEFIREEKRLLLTSTDLSLNQACDQVNQLGGLFIPAHVNRKAFGLIEVLGFIPEDISVPVVEISIHTTPHEALLRFPQLQHYTLIHSGDAHRLDEILGLNLLTILSPCISEIRKAMNNLEGRRLQILPR